MPELSIIVPVFNTEKYLRECVDSILAQTFTDFELILVDDGSKDSSLEICKEYEKKDKRVKVIHQENGGPGKARNKGLENATGEWIGFVDSDDWIEKETYETALNIAKQKNADLVQWELAMEYSEKSVLNKCKPDGFFTAEQSGEYYTSFVYTKIYKSKIIEKSNIRFPIYSNFLEDALFNFLYYQECKILFYYGKCLYHYRQQQKSISHKFSKNLISDELKVIEEITKKEKVSVESDYVKRLKRNAKIHCLFLNTPDYKLFRELYPEIKYKDLITSEMSFKMKIWIFLVCAHFDFLASFLWKIRHFSKGGEK